MQEFRRQSITAHLALLISLFFSNNIGATVDGKSLTFDSKKGNCLACHAIDDGSSPGNIGPELKDMKTRYPDRNLLRQRIWDETMFNPVTVMPPFGKHKILTEQEIDLIVDYIHSL